jgi:ABC-type uncharacterized transport system substrate-binding protein
MGAAAVLEIDRPELGWQAGEIASRILNGTPAAEASITWPERTTLRTNGSVIRHLGIVFGHLDIMNTFAAGYDQPPSLAPFLLLPGCPVPFACDSRT